MIIAYCRACGITPVGRHDRLTCPSCGHALTCSTHLRSEHRRIERRKARTGRAA
jgi:uncharacterized Zn finger protein (UPF0148 family)